MSINAHQASGREGYAQAALTTSAAKSMNAPISTTEQTAETITPASTMHAQASQNASITKECMVMTADRQLSATLMASLYLIIALAAQSAAENLQTSASSSRAKGIHATHRRIATNRP